MTPRIEILPEKKLVGMHLTMSLTENKTGDLWRGFMPRRKEIQNALGTDFFALQFYPPQYFEHFSPETTFTKWATMEVADFEEVPEGMEALTLPGGLYAVFLHKGDASMAQKTFQHIYGVWLPNSGYSLDDRPHFEILGEKYKNNDPNSEEEIWIPILKQ